MGSHKEYHQAECVNCHEVKYIAAKGLCRACYWRQKRHGTFEYTRWGKITVCRAEGCGSRAIARGLCDLHRVRGVEPRPLSQTPAAIASRLWRKEKSTGAKNRDLKKTFGITYETYKQMEVAQNGVCAICGQTETFTHHMTKKIANLAVDHCHKTGKIRGLLCHKCNHGLGKFDDDVSLLRKAATYLEHHA